MVHVVTKELDTIQKWNNKQRSTEEKKKMHLDFHSGYLAA